MMLSKITTVIVTLPKTKSLPLKIGHPKRKRWSSNYHFLGGELLVSGRVCPSENLSPSQVGTLPAWA